MQEFPSAGLGETPLAEGIRSHERYPAATTASTSSA